MRKLIVGAAALVVFGGMCIPFLANVAGDAQVHLAIAESFVKGRPFRYNAQDPLIMASTSPFWTMLLVACFRLAGSLFTPLAMKAASFICWGTVTYQLYSEVAAIVIVFSGVLFYSFVVGGEHVGRYLLPIFPFFFLVGFDGWWSLLKPLSGKYSLIRTCAIVFSLVYLAFGSGVDFYRRVALRQNFSWNLLETMAAPQNREQRTTGLLRDLGVDSTLRVRFAINEVQLRYFVDDRIDVISLDGRTSSQILRYIDKNTGTPDFENYFEQTRPDFVDLGQATVWGSWTSRFEPTKSDQNLLVAWGRRASSMKVGESFNWRGRTVVLMTPSIMKIVW